MEITVKDLQFFKLSPSLIYLIKCIHDKEDELIEELNKVVPVMKMAESLQSKLTIKIIDNKLISDSFEIRKLDIINYLNNEVVSTNKIIEHSINDVIDYFIKVTGKSRISKSADSNRKFIRARLKEYNVKDLKDVIDLKNAQWRYDPKMSSYIRISTLFNAEKFQGYIGEVDNVELNNKDFSDDI